MKIRWRKDGECTPSESGELATEAPDMLIVGRLSNADIALEDDTVSRIHAKIFVHRGGVEIADAQSANGTSVAGQRVTRAPWLPGQQVRIGGFLLDLAEGLDGSCGPGQSPLAPLSLGAAAAPVHLAVSVTQGDIVEAGSDVLVMGALDTMFLSSAARTINRSSDNILETLQKSGRLDFRLGATTLIPAAQGDMACNFILCVGLGAADMLARARSAQERTARIEATIRSLGLYAFEYLLQFRLRSMATVLPLSGLSGAPGTLAQEFIRGCLSAVLKSGAAPGGAALPTIDLRELDADRYGEIHASLTEESQRLGDAAYRSDAFGAAANGRPISLQLQRKEELPASPPVAPTQILREPVKLEIRALGRREGDDALQFELSCQRPGGYAFADTQQSCISPEVLQTQIAEIYDRSRPQDYRAGVTRAVCDRLIPASIRQAVAEEVRQRPLCLTIDAGVAMIPWEVMLFDEAQRTSRRVTRILRAAGVGAVRPMATELRLPVNLLLVVNPTGDLPQAEEEGARIAQIANRYKQLFNVTVLRGAEAKKDQVIKQLVRSQPHVMHFCGHANFSADNPKESGLICHGGSVLTGIDMYSINPMPSVLVFNACLSGRLPELAHGDTSGGYDPAAPMTSIAEAAIFGGVSSLVGTLWPVGDQEAATFAQSFYDSLLDHKTVGEAVARSRAVVRAAVPASFDWANYVLYGDDTVYLRPPAPQSC